MSLVRYEFGDCEFYDEDEGGETGKEAQGYEEAAEQFGEDDQGKGNAMTDMEGIGEDILEVSEVLYFVETIEVTEDKPEYRADRKCCDVERGFGVGGGEELFHV
jgi:hypothetical protein